MTINQYATLAEYKSFETSRGQGASVSTDVSDDAVISALLDQVARYVDLHTDRHFYPSYESRLYSIPRHPEPRRQIQLDDDLLAVVSFTNGDASTITNADYVLRSPNATPYWQIALRDTSTVSWQYNTAGSFEQVLTLTGWWGYREYYAQRAWVLAGTLGAAITDTTTKAFTMTAGHTLTAGSIAKIDSEIYNVTSVVTNAITPNQRGDNGSTSATHSNGASVYYWDVQPDIKLAVLETALGVNAMRHGQANSGKISVTAAGVVIRPEEVPPMAQKTFDAYRRIR